MLRNPINIRYRNKSIYASRTRNTTIFFDQINNIAAHLQDIKYDEEFYDIESDMPLVNVLQQKKNKSNAQFSRKELKARSDWKEWQQSEYKQLDLYELQNMFGKPTTK